LQSKCWGGDDDCGLSQAWGCLAMSLFGGGGDVGQWATDFGRMSEEEVLSGLECRRHKLDLGPQMCGLLDSDCFSDVIVRVEQEEINAHSAILAARSPVFEAMLSCGMREHLQKEIVIHDLDPVAVRRMIGFMYTGTLEPKLERDGEALALLEAAHLYDVAVLVDLCVSNLCSCLTEENATAYLMLAEHTELHRFRSRCLEFITNSHARVADTHAMESYGHLTQKRPQLAIDVLARAFPPTKRARTTTLAFSRYAPVSSVKRGGISAFAADMNLDLDVSEPDSERLAAFAEEMQRACEEEARQQGEHQLALLAEADSALIEQHLLNSACAKSR